MNDVRMKGFPERTSVERAWQWIASQVAVLDCEPVGLLAAANRVLSERIVSPVDVPGFERAMMDGYAVKSEETLGATPYNRLAFDVVGDSLPGRPFPGRMESRQAVRIMTGAPLPDGADAVLPVEQTEVEASQMFAQGEVPPGKHVGRRGEDILAGSEILPAGRPLRPQDVGLLSSIGRSSLPVVRRPGVSVLVTGNELLPAGSPPHGCSIADSNGPMLAALVSRDGGLITAQRMVRDDPREILAALRDTPCDVILVSGGSSVGLEDHVPRLIAEHGKLAVHGVAMRPSSPSGMGTIDGRLVFLLPGNPVSCLCAYDFFAGRAIRLLGGHSPDWPYTSVRLPLRRKLVSVIGRLDYARVEIVHGEVEPLAISGASLLSSTTRADGFVVIPADSEGFAAGSEVPVFLYHSGHETARHARTETIS